MTSTRSLIAFLVVGVPLAVGFGALAAAFNDGPYLVTLIVFGLAALPAAGGLGVVAFGDHQEPEYGEETIEHNWAVRATSAAFLDTITALGLFVAVIFTFDIEIEARLTMFAVLVLAMADAPIRYLLLRRRES